MEVLRSLVEQGNLSAIQPCSDSITTATPHGLYILYVPFSGMVADLLASRLFNSLQCTTREELTEFVDLAISIKKNHALTSLNAADVYDGLGLTDLAEKVRAYHQFRHPTTIDVLQAAVNYAMANPRIQELHAKGEKV